MKKQKFRTKRHRGPKISGGIAVYVRQSIAKNFKVIPTKNVDSIWIEKTSQTGESMRMGFYYCSPEGGTVDFDKTVGGEIERLTIGDKTFIFGDFNARTRTDQENITHDKYDDELGIPTVMKEIPLPRNSEDMKLVNKRGHDFLDMCKTNDLSIVNGRTVGDIFGKYTCHQSRGSSVVDYLIVPYKTLPNVSEFVVGEHIPTLSDHCSICANLNIEVHLVEETPVEVELKDLPRRYLWNSEADQTFKDMLKSDTFQRKVEIIMNTPDNPDLVHDIRNLLTDAADKCRVKKSKTRPNHQDPPWFSDECRELKKKIQEYGKALRKDPHNVNTRQNLYINKNKLRNLVRKNKFFHKKSIIDTMCSNLSSGKKKEYWKMLRKLDDPLDKTKYIPDQQLIDHFKEILTDPSLEKPSTNTTSANHNAEVPEQQGLDYAINKDELDRARRILKTGKSPGIDTLMNEMIDILVELYPSLVLKLFNNIFSNNWFCEEWLLSLITSLHKKGDKEDPDNYRGISLISCMAKLFLTIINNRLTLFSVERGILSPNQLGFVHLNRTSDPHIILNTIIQKYCHNKKKKLYGCFVDFSKAFDSVPRDILLNKLKLHGIEGKVFEIIKTIYTKDKAAVKIGNKFSPPFKTTRGVRQGCVLSPLLFNIFLADIQETFDTCGDSPNLNGQDISCLIWADDILILSETEEGLQKKLDSLGAYCKVNKLKVNTDKTKIMTFTKSGKLLHRHFYYGKKKLENVREYKYLGFIVTPSGETRTGLEDLRVRALRAIAKIRKSLGPLFQQNIWNSLHLYNYMVRPILLYVSDFWGALKHPNNSPIERVHLSFMKQLLGVRRQTNTSAVYLELNTVPLLLHARKSAVKNWDRIRQNRCNSLLIATYEEAVRENLQWISSIKHLFGSSGLLEVYHSQEEATEEKSTPWNLLLIRLTEQFHQLAMEDINKEGGKLQLYKILKTTPHHEKYLSDIQNIRHRTAMTRLRLSSHNLNIETGRHTGTDRADRLCTLCKNGIEDETHFLITCPMYEDLRLTHLSDFSHILTDNTKSDHEKATMLLKNENIKPIAKFVYNAFETRGILLDSLLALDNIVEAIAKQEEISTKIVSDVSNTLEDIVRKVEKTELNKSKEQSVNMTTDCFIVKSVSVDGLKIVFQRSKGDNS